ncbi:hypothetical protein BLA27_24600 [Brucella cytisi]|uniref:Uncharacterized protein n=1 Tax=Brucella cytisi TaxID=407152 RepID=A0A1J6HW07_9HYPH|nr:hypothetical protein BLA27_24600 [Brucella cytisi]
MKNHIPINALDIQFRSTRLLLARLLVLSFRVRCLIHARRFERRPWRQVFQPHNFIAKELVLNFKPGVFQTELGILLTECCILSFQLFKPSLCTFGFLNQTRDQTAQRVQ